MTYTQEQKAVIKANPMNRENCRNIRFITTYKYRDYQNAERALAGATPSNRKDLNAKFEAAKSAYEEARGKFDLYKEIFPDIVQ